MTSNCRKRKVLAENVIILHSPFFFGFKAGMINIFRLICQLGDNNARFQQQNYISNGECSHKHHGCHSEKFYALPYLHIQYPLCGGQEQNRKHNHQNYIVAIDTEFSWCFCRCLMVSGPNICLLFKLKFDIWELLTLLSTIHQKSARKSTKKFSLWRQQERRNEKATIAESDANKVGKSSEGR